MTREFVVWLHRWVGLLMALFLFVVGLTGSMLAFRVDIQRLINPQLFAKPSSPGARQLDLATLAERAEAEQPHIRVGYFSVGPDYVDMRVHPRTNPATGKPYADVKFDHMILNPWTGRDLDNYGQITLGERFRLGFMPFVYDLHESLALGSFGAWMLGIVALAWTLDTVYAIYLTFPVTLARFFARWKIAWKIKWPTSTYRLNFDLHRASGLWCAPLLFMFAWSSVMFNLSEVYDWTTAKIFGTPVESSVDLKTIHPSHPVENPKLSWREALGKSQQYMDEIAKKEGITIIKPFGLAYLSEVGVYSYEVESSINISRGIWMGGLSVWVDGQTGELQKVERPTEDEPGLAVGTWLYTLHFANLYGWLAYRIVVCVLGIVIAMLSVTGVYIWWKKRKARSVKHRIAT